MERCRASSSFWRALLDFCQIDHQYRHFGIWRDLLCALFPPKVVMRMAEDMWARLLEGEDPFRIEAFWRRAYGSGYVLRPDISAMGIASGLEMACWDIIGKALDKPVYELLGGLVHPRLRAYSYLYPEPGDKSLVYEDPDLLASRAADSVQKGFTAVKFDPVGAYSVFDPRQLSLENLSQAERMVRCVREAVGDKCDLLIGTHGQMTPSGALRLARRIEPFDPFMAPKSPCLRTICAPCARLRARPASP